MHVTVVGELDAVVDEVQQHLANPADVADQAARHVVRDFERELDVLLGGARREQVEHFFHGLVEIVRDVFQLDAAGLDLREVQDVVDDDQQALGGPANRAGEVHLLGIELGIHQQVAEADHAVHRRADLVAHRREELALGAVRRFCFVARFRHLLAVRVDARECFVERVREIAELVVRRRAL